MNFREHFEAWHKRTYGYSSPGKGTALNYKYSTDKQQARWEAWQACSDWHIKQEAIRAQRLRENNGPTIHP